MKSNFAKILFYRVLFMVLVGISMFILDQWIVPSYNLLNNYHHIRNVLIAAFLTISSFLLSIEGIVLTKALEIFNDKIYKKQFQVQKKINPLLSNVDLFSPLDNSNDLISATILFSLCTSVFHIAYVFFNNAIVAATCFGFTSVTFYSVVKVVLIMRSIYMKWIQSIRSKQQA